MSNEGLRDELIQWVTRYQDAAERNALAETPEETADYLLSLLPPVRAHTLKEVADELARWDSETPSIALGRLKLWLKRKGIMPGEKTND